MRQSEQNIITRWTERLIGKAETVDKKLAVWALELADRALPKEAEGDGTDLWEDLKLLEKSADITTAFRRIRTMALAYKSEFLQETFHQKSLLSVILQCLVRMKPYYRKDMELFGNWWDYDIGGAQALMDSLVLLSEEPDLKSELVSHYLEAVHAFVPSPEWATRPHMDPLQMTGANLTDTSQVCILRALLEKEESGIRQVQQAMKSLLPFVTGDDGFYEDGSYIQHHHIPYAGGYGPCLLDSFENIAYLLFGTEYSVTELSDFSNTSRWILDSFLPFLRNGEMMDLVRGRKTSRSQEKAHDTGRLVMSTILLLADYQPEEIRLRIRRIIKGELARDGYEREKLYQGLRPCQAEALQSILGEDLEPQPQREEYRVYGNMDRVLIHRKEYAFGISMFSNRTGRFSFGNGENKKGYHACEGALYLYTDDAGQFDDNYWPTVDTMRLPGITTDHTGTELVAWKDNRNSKYWVGGASLLNRYGSTGMDVELEQPDSDLTGKKSWFAFEDGLVCLGAGICASTGDFVETIIENRSVSGECLLADGKALKLADGVAKELYAKQMTLKSAYLPISYYFPDHVPVTVKKEYRTGCWHDLNDGGSAEPLSNSFVSIAISHGSRPKNVSYSYVIVPGKEKMESAPWNILSNTEKIQAAEERGNGLTGINFWEAGSIQTAAGTLTAEAPCSVIMKEESGKLSLGISDPTHQRAELRLRLAGRYDGYLVIDTKESHGGTHFVTLSLSDTEMA